ncbi:MAG: phage major capsid protein, partial [Thermoleophilia bacterium]|nr:phage major capsid protein [Thermoleophilia bacterium]
ELRSLTTNLAESVTAATAALGRRPVIRTAADGSIVADSIEAGESEADRRRGPGDFVVNVARAGGMGDLDEQRAAQERLAKVYGVSRALSEGTGTTGGYTTTVQFETQVLQVSGEEQIFLPFATEVPLGAREVEWPALDQYQAPAAGQSAYYGGVRVYRRGEAASRTQTQPAFNKVKLIAQDLTAYTEISRDLLQDSTAALDAMIPKLFGGAIGWRCDWEAINGTGAGMMLGVRNAPCVISVTRNTSSTIKYQDIFKMYTRLLSSERGFARWYVHPFTMETLMSITDPSNRFIFLPTYTGPYDGPLAAKPSGTLLGIPLVESEKCPVLGAAGDINLWSPRRYLHGKRSGLEIGLSEHFKFDSDQVAFRAKIRNDGKPQLLNSITLSDGAGTNKQTAFVTLAA